MKEIADAEQAMLQIFEYQRGEGAYSKRASEQNQKRQRIQAVW
jgi:hypothetical protein